MLVHNESGSDFKIGSVDQTYRKNTKNNKGFFIRDKNGQMLIKV